MSCVTRRTFYKCLYLHLLLPKLNHCLNQPYYHLIVDHLVKKRSAVNIQKQNKSEVANTETVMPYNEELSPPPPHDISNVFAAEYLSSHSSSDSNKYKCAWLKAEVIRFSISSAGECPDACIRAISICIK